MASTARIPKNLRNRFEQEALPHLPQLYAAAFYLTNDRSEAEDLLQETYLRGLQNFDKFQPGTNCKAWLLSIQRNLYISSYRKTRRKPEMVGWERFEEAYSAMVEERLRSGPENYLSSKLVGAHIQRALKELPEIFRTAVFLVDLQGLTYEEATEVMGCSIGTARSRVSRGRRLLEALLKDYSIDKSSFQK